jgi:hypothetical protein
MNPILLLIYHHEAPLSAQKAQGVDNPYDVVSSFIPAAHRPKHRLTTYPIGEVLEWQAFVVKRGSKSSAAGAPQIIRPTLAALVARGKARTDETYSAEVQDRLALSLMGSLTGAPERIGDKLARIWASLPVHSDQQGRHRWVKRGQSYYEGDGLNAAHATPEAVLEAIRVAQAPVPPVGDYAALEARVAALEASHAVLARHIIELAGDIK